MATSRGLGLKNKRRMFQFKAYDRLSSQELGLIPDDYTKTRQCLQCGRQYREIDNIGRYACRLHPGIAVLDVMKNGYYYTCCQKHIDSSNGCVRADHMDYELPVNCLETRHDAISSECIYAIPIIYFLYGIRQPVKQSVLYHSSQRVNIINTVKPFPISINVGEYREYIDRSVESSAIPTNLQ
jgi:hypothetical protein